MISSCPGLVYIYHPGCSTLYNCSAHQSLSLTYPFIIHHTSSLITPISTIRSSSPRWHLPHLPYWNRAYHLDRTKADRHIISHLCVYLYLYLHQVSGSYRTASRQTTGTSQPRPRQARDSTTQHKPKSPKSPPKSPPNTSHHTVISHTTAQPQGSVPDFLTRAQDASIGCRNFPSRRCHGCEVLVLLASLLALPASREQD